MAPAKEHHIQIARTARYHTLGDPSGSPREVWFVLHGHSQLSAYFIRHFAVLDDGSRLIVAPEGLNRFYLDQAHSRGGTQARVGATWMTREDRLAEIEDYVGYLDALHAAVVAPLRPSRFVVLGFSQGVATACRWLARGRVRADLAVLWAGPLPAELNAESAAPLQSTRVIRVLGDADDIADPGAVAMEDTLAARMGLNAEKVSFAGGHEIDADTLKKIAV